MPSTTKAEIGGKTKIDLTLDDNEESEVNK